VSLSLLITEVNSNATGGDYFEIYNFGTTAIDMSGWKWTDEAAAFSTATAVFPSGTTLGAGARLLVVAQTTDATAFRAAWGLPANAQVIAVGGPALGKQDAVVVFNSSGAVVAAFNYDTDSVTASDSTVITTALASSGTLFADNQHVGTAYNGGTAVDKTSAVWDGVSTSSPAYKAAVTGALGGYAQTGDSASVGSPGSVVVITTPSVNLSVSAATGTEVGTTAITVTATASAAVSGAQTLTVGVAGTNITAGDYTLSDTTLTIADGAITGSGTFTVVDDAVLESTETATVSISSPSAGIILGSTTSQAISITDNEAAGAVAYSGAFNEGLAFDGSVSGKVLITLSGGETFVDSGTNMLTANQATITNAPAGLTAVLTRTSNTTAELSFTGTSGTHTHASDVSNLTVTFANSAFTGNSAAAVTNATKADLAINFADIGTAGTAQTFTPNTGTTVGSSDASAAIALDANYMVVGDDEASVLRVFDRAGGNAVLEWSYSAALANGGELDLEVGTRIGDTLYFTGSHSNSKSGAESNTREFLFAVTVSGSGAETVFTYQGTHSGLEISLTTWDSTNAHTKGANYFGFAASSVTGVVPEGVNGFSIEGMTATQDGSQLLLAFRAPQTSISTREKAVIVPVAVTGLIGSSSPTIGTPVELNLGGRGIRSIEKAADGNGYLLLAGPAGGASTEVANDFRLYHVSTDLTTVTELDVNLDTLRDTTMGSFETIVDVRTTTTGTLVQLLQDNGDTDWADRTGTTVSKDLPAADQKFQGNWVTLGGAATDSTGPTLASAQPADEATNIGISSNLVLKFNEGVKAGAGSFVIKKTSDDSVVETIAANDSKVLIAFNTVTINPSADLAYGTGFYVETTGTALSDHAGNGWAGIAGATTLNFTTAGAPISYSLLITEVNSNAAGGDFFELYNFGSTAIDLTGWKWIDDAASPAHANSRDFGAVTSLAAGAKLIVISDKVDIADFRTKWNNLDPSVQVITGATAGPGLGGSGDAVVVFNQAGQVATAFNYKTANVTASDGTVIAPSVRADSAAVVSGHAGVAMGGTAGANGVSAVWDGVSTSSPAYKAAVAGSLGAYTQSAATANIGSPGLLSALPSITSNLGGATAAVSVAENSTAATTVVATDADIQHQRRRGCGQVQHRCGHRRADLRHRPQL